ncbi:hypothetical protein NQ176_g9129 [Zarea fungicola]|uniref:Uncharacterized protein n=1 Tax=Zarea fungicola TaxID=93591 RepID=A0ACC1MQC7_9HYPO|nr:hypothetical protein NQ176_g9129 [Lecanicillium fungicola]
MAFEAADRAFWPPIPSLFDFTLKFEESIFTIAPSAVALIFIPCMIVYYLRKEVVVRRSQLLWFKLLLFGELQLASGALVAIKIASLGIRSSSSEFRTTASLPAASLEFLASIAVLLLLYVEHVRALRESAFLGLYLSITFLLEIAKCRSYFRRPGLDALGGLAAAAAILRFSIICLEEVPKTSLIIDENLRKITGAEASAGFWKRYLYVWLNPLIWKGYRSTISVEDIGEIGAEFASRHLFEDFHPRWVAQDKLATMCLARALLGHLWIHWLFCFVARLAFTGFSFSLPFILLRMTEVITDPGPNAKDIGDSLIGATGLVDEIGHLDVKSAQEAADKEEWEEVEETEAVEDNEVAIRVDQYLVVFLKFMASVTPGIEHDFTMGV